MSYVPTTPPAGDEIFLLKMGEMVLKGLNRRTFEERLMGNARRRLQKYGKFRIYSRQSITYIEPKEPGCDMDGAFDTLSRLFGVVGLSRAKACEKTPEAILETAKTYLREDLLAARTFKVESKRSDKTFPMTSIQLSQFVGGELNEAFSNLQADMHHPELTVHVEVRDFAAYVHGDPTPGAGGLPVGVGGKAVSLLSGGIDSPVASWMMAKRGVALEMVHFFSYPYTSPEAKEKVLTLAKLLTPWCGRLTVHVVPFTRIQEQLRLHCPEALFTLLMRRFMMRISQRVAQRVGAHGLITGESPGPGGQPDHGGPWPSPARCAPCPSSGLWWGWTRRRSSGWPGRSAPLRPPSSPTRTAAPSSPPGTPRPTPSWRRFWRPRPCWTWKPSSRPPWTASKGWCWTREPHR